MSRQENIFDTFKTKAELVSAVVSDVQTIHQAFTYALELCDHKQACQLLVSGCEEPLSESAGDLCESKREKIIAAPGLEALQQEHFSLMCRERGISLATEGLRRHLAGIDIGFAIADYGIADTGTLVLNSSSEEVHLATMISEVHVMLLPKSKILATSYDLEDELKQFMQSPPNYTAFITGASRTADIERVLAKDPVFAEVLRCVRCGACANVCPVYRMVGGHQYGHIYIGAIGLILTYFFHGREKARNLIQNCINCEACKAVCAAGIDLPRLIKEIHARIQDEEGHPVKSVLLSKVLRNRKFFHALLRSAQIAQKPVTGGTPYLRHLPQIFSKEHNFKALPAIAEKPFRDRWPEIRPRVAAPEYRVALFSGCVQDFVYPEQLEAAVQVMADHKVALDFPMNQTCCGLPVQMMGEKEAARDVALQNITAVDADQYDYILTLCASCAAHLKKNYPKILAETPDVAGKVQTFADKVIAFSSFMNDVLKVDHSAYEKTGLKATYHAPCHLCRGLGIKDAPHELIEKSGFTFVAADEEETCCGFGGTYSSKFPHISAEILSKKLDDIQKTCADVLVTECPGCVMQLRGGIEKRGDKITVKHMAEAMAENKKRIEYRRK